MNFSETLAKCRYDEDCMKNAYCWDQEACLCKDGFIVNKNRTHLECLKGTIFKYFSLRYNKTYFTKF